MKLEIEEVTVLQAGIPVSESHRRVHRETNRPVRYTRRFVVKLLNAGKNNELTGESLLWQV